MAVDFDRDRMEAVLDAHERWWRGELDRPLVKVVLEKDLPRVRALCQANCHEVDRPAEAVVDAIDGELQRCTFLGDAFPMVDFAAFGLGVLAALCGARLDNATGGVWFFPDKERPIEEISIRYDPENPWARRIKDLYRAGLAKWEGKVLLGLPDLGGVLDVVATFRGSENLLLDLYDAPEEVLRLAQEAQDAWYAAFDDFCAVLSPQRGTTHWSGLASREPSYIPQCDFCYMIGNPMFREFVLPTLRRDVERLAHSIYHLDGVGELRHLDDVLALEALEAVQWVPGDGQPGRGALDRRLPPHRRRGQGHVDRGRAQGLPGGPGRPARDAILCLLPARVGAGLRTDDSQRALRRGAGRPRPPGLFYRFPLYQ